MYPSSGAGDYLGTGLTHGAGDEAHPLAMGAGNYLNFEQQGFDIIQLERDFLRGADVDGNWVGNEGGYVLQLFSPSGAFEHGPYRVKLVDSAGQTWPVDEGGCHSTQVGKGIVCEPQRRNTIIQFATPRAPRGTFYFRVWDARGLAFSLPVIVRLVAPGRSREVTSVRTLPNTVYNPWPDKGGRP